MRLAELRKPCVPSADLLRYLQYQNAAFCNTAPGRTAKFARHPPSSRRRLTTTTCYVKDRKSRLKPIQTRHATLYTISDIFLPQNARYASTEASSTSFFRRLFPFKGRRKPDSSNLQPNDLPTMIEDGLTSDNSNMFNLSRSLKRPSGVDLKLRCTEFDKHGSVTLVSGEFKKSELIAKYGLLPRDLRKIDSSILPHILIRPSAILINLLHLRCLIQSDRVLVFDAYGSTDTYTQSVFMYDLEGKLRQKSGERGGSTYLPYEFRALEAVLISVTQGLEAEFEGVREPVVRVLRELEEDIDRDKLRHLLIHSKKMSSFEQKARLARDAINDLLDADDDLAAMYLTEQAAGKKRAENDHQEVEMLLESYHKICEEIVEISGNLISNIRNTEEVVKAILDANRNSLMLLDLKFSIGTLGLGTGTLIAGLYGMNLKNFIEESDAAFTFVAITCFGLSAIVCLYGLKKLRRVQRVRMWGEGYSSSFSKDGRLGRGNWRSEAMDHALRGKIAGALMPREERLRRTREAKGMHSGMANGNGTGTSYGYGGRVLWPGMDGLRLQESESESVVAEPTSLTPNPATGKHPAAAATGTVTENNDSSATSSAHRDRGQRKGAGAGAAETSLSPDEEGPLFETATATAGKESKTGLPMSIEPAK